ncbi:MAG: peptidyl-prolyl cis-trans isomerase [Desulfatibacillum sp.]|nr:peptidyl-prolyl cis-trans isomerase [Desulfatibacillum sp.]
MKKYYLIAFLSALLALMVASPVLADGELVDRIVAIVNTDVVMLSELETRMIPVMSQIQASTLSEEDKEKLVYQEREEMLRSMVSSLIARQECEKLGVKVLEEEIDAYMERFKQASSLTDEALRNQLKRDGLTMEMLRSQVRDTILFLKLKNTEVDSKIVVTEKEIQDYYKEHEEEYAGQKQYHLRYILLPYPENATQEDKDAVAKTMGEIIAMHKAGEAFPSLIENAASEKVGGSGGDLGLFFVSDLTKDLGDLVVTMAAGDITSPMPVDQGLQIFWLEEIKPGEGRNLEQATEEIQMVLYNNQVQAKYNQWVSELEKSSYVKIIR